MRTVALLFLLVALCSCDISEEMKTAFLDHGVVPDVVREAPKGILNVSYQSGVAADLGNELTPTQVKDKPILTWEADEGAYYSLLLVDPDAPSRSNPKNREFRHWQIMNIPGSAIDEGDEVIEYIGAGAPKGTGLHRYIFLVYKQPNGMIRHTEPLTTNRSPANRPKTSASNFATKYKLGSPKFANFFQAQYDSYVDELHAQLKG